MLALDGHLDALRDADGYIGKRELHSHGHGLSDRSASPPRQQRHLRDAVRRLHDFRLADQEPERDGYRQQHDQWRQQQRLDGELDIGFGGDGIGSIQRNWWHVTFAGR